ncbi:MAG: hypothetical protein IIW20_00865, partial [Clostridia bacterium]|nr:hypothetical protein [Clostridia bacterium]
MTVYTLTYQAPPVDRREILRYAGVGESNGETEALLTRCLKETGNLTYKVCYCELPASELEITSSTLEKALSGCDSAILFGATVGIEMDRLI